MPGKHQIDIAGFVGDFFGDADFKVCNRLAVNVAIFVFSEVDHAPALYRVWPRMVLGCLGRFKLVEVQRFRRFQHKAEFVDAHIDVVAAAIYVHDTRLFHAAVNAAANGGRYLGFVHVTVTRCPRQLLLHRCLVEQSGGNQPCGMCHIYHQYGSHFISNLAHALVVPLA